MNLLVIAAHMDDEVLGPGATIARHAREGHRVTVCIACKRAYNHRFDKRKVEAERAACRTACKILGVHEVLFMDLRDELLDQRLLDVIVPLEAVMAKVRPEIVYTHHRGDNNQDHRAVFQATAVACRSFHAHAPRRLLCYEVPSSTDIAPPFPEFAFQPTFFVDIKDFLPLKIKALQAYRRELREFPHPRSVEGLRVLAAKRGMEVGLAAAEAFVTVRERWD